MSYWFFWMLQNLSADLIWKKNDSWTNLLHFLILLQVCYKNFHTFSFSFIVFINYVSSFNYPCVPFKLKMVYWSTAGSQNYCNWNGSKESMCVIIVERLFKWHIFRRINIVFHYRIKIVIQNCRMICIKTIFGKKIKTPRQMGANDIIKLTQFSSIWWDLQLIAVFASFQEVFKMCQTNIAVHLMYWGAYNVATQSPFPI